MYPHMNEDVAWQHMQDLQREMENSRQLAAGSLPRTLVALLGLLHLLGRLRRSAWHLALDRFHRGDPERGLEEGTVDHWLKRTQAVAGERDGEQEVA